ncbi:aldo/keto reductase [Deinococcus cellulosilyticus]|uniref:Aldo/keto reductase n=1 Tax=Deinococcus cellulosilyticus (strain DSM 18568 / NBRC 106333 / KACC 11606 / 5516J-15) TaxID=1223518 RepID=A0A511N506_DEIC1|nr:aldo/keto reductase [Deinococcus cellulosilyticus]GEM47932.1 aldo/keto reductase [Deinococcus cellulosilyticus NBRC 106333 = KACC 11606]
MIYRNFGTAGFQVSALGFGAGHIGWDQLDENFVGSLLNEVVNAGITLIDTARGYDLSEERIGRHLSWRRGDFILSTKGGYGVENTPDWTRENIHRGVDRALRTMRTDHLDIFHLHSCPLGTLQDEKLLKALQEVKTQGKVRAVAYSGENEALEWAVQSGVFDSIQCSVNPFDQRSIPLLSTAKDRGMGVIAKRPLGNVPWTYAERPTGQYAEEYWLRMQAMGYTPPIPWDEFALRFTVFTEGVSSAIVGSRNLQNILRNIEILEQGPLGSEVYLEMREVFEAHDQEWIGQV